MDDELNEDLGDTWRDVDSDDELSPPATPVRRLLLKDRRNASIQRKGIGFNSLLLYGAFPLIMALCALCVSPIKFPNQFESFIGSSIVLLHNPSQHLVENLFPEDSITDQDDNTHSSSPSSYLWNDISAKYNYLTWMIHHYLHSLRDDTVLGQDVSERTANVPMNESIDVSASADTKNEHQGADVVSSSWWDVVGYFIGEPTAHMEQQEVSSKSERERDEVLTAAMTIKDSAINDQKKKFSGDADYSAVETSGETYSFICYLFSYFSDAVCTSSEADGAEGVSVSREEEMNLDIDNAAVEIASGSERSPIKRDAVSKETADGIGEVSVQEGNNVDEDVSVGESVWNALISWVRSWGFVIAFLIIAVAGVVSSSTWSEDSIHTDIDGNTYSVDAGADFQLSTMPPSFYGGAKSNFKTPRGAIRRSAAKGGTTVGRRHEAMMNYGGIDVLTYYTGQTENKRHSLLHLADEAAGSVDDIASGNENTHPYQLRSQDRSRRSRRAPDRFVA